MNNELINDLKERVAIHLIDYLEALKLKDINQSMYNKAFAYSAIIEIKYTFSSMHYNELISNEQHKELQDYINGVMEKIKETY